MAFSVPSGTGGFAAVGGRLRLCGGHAYAAAHAASNPGSYGTAGNGYCYANGGHGCAAPDRSGGHGDTVIAGVSQNYPPPPRVCGYRIGNTAAGRHGYTDAAYCYG